MIFLLYYNLDKLITRNIDNLTKKKLPNYDHVGLWGCCDGGREMLISSSVKNTTAFLEWSSAQGSPTCVTRSYFPPHYIERAMHDQVQHSHYAHSLPTNHPL